ncbi:tail fiber domain-containing protein, partial [Candidatus Kaiserbacteria bacterium]|nr:tail fiber domain-containing protein [Candidatus Kaiserbacteria bacterium]
SLGFIAQEVEEIFPELVITDTAGYKNLDYSKLTAVLAKAVQELYAQVTALATQVNDLAATVLGFQEEFTTQRLCLGETCITEAELQQLLNERGIAPASSGGASDAVTDDGSNDTPASSGDTGSGESDVSNNGDTEEPVGETTPEPAPAEIVVEEEAPPSAEPVSGSEEGIGESVDSAAPEASSSESAGSESGESSGV